jgi:hypothetical protein
MGPEALLTAPIVKIEPIPLKVRISITPNRNRVGASGASKSIWIFYDLVGRNAANVCWINHWGTEREGFEPSVPARVQRFSRPPRSTAPAPLPMSQAHGRVGGFTYSGTAPARKPWQSWRPHRAHHARFPADGAQPPATCLVECRYIGQHRRNAPVNEMNRPQARQSRPGLRVQRFHRQGQRRRHGSWPVVSAAQ